LKNIDKSNYEQTLLILDDFDLNTPIEYTNSKGDTFSNNIRDIYFHVINHSTHHRGQIASEFRQYGINPLVSDYIFYKRTSLPAKMVLWVWLNTTDAWSDELPYRDGGLDFEQSKGEALLLPTKCFLQ